MPDNEVDTGLVLTESNIIFIGSTFSNGLGDYDTSINFIYYYAINEIDTNNIMFRILNLNIQFFLYYSFLICWILHLYSIDIM